MRGSLRRQAPPPARRGVVMFMALATLAVVAAIAAAMLQGAVVARRQLRSERDLIQVECLLDHAAARALAGSAVVSGTLSLPVEAIVGSASARITTSPVTGAAGGPAVRLVVEYPLEGPVTIRRTREVPLPPSTATPEPPSITANPEENRP